MNEFAPPRVVIEQVAPTVDGGRFPAKVIVGDPFVVEADLFADGHDLVCGRVVVEGPSGDGASIQALPLESLGNDRFRVPLTFDRCGRYSFQIEAWVDTFTTWADALAKRLDAEQDVELELEIGAGLLAAASDRAPKEARAFLLAARERMNGPEGPSVAAQEAVRQAVRAHPDPRSVSSLPHPLKVVVDIERAVFGAWYELFPRSLGATRHGTFQDVEERLPYIQNLGFDVLYLPPIHPIGRVGRKGENNTLKAKPGDLGSPWAIGAKEGGHTAIHPDLGTLEDFEALIEAARQRGIDVAIDMAFQCAPDHPWVKEHPEWFNHRPDGSIRYAENPPKRYEDIYPLNFETPEWSSLWAALRDVVLYWCAHGVGIFRVDNPHTKPFAFWEWLLAEVKARYPETIFLAEAFTRPKVMYRLAKLGFTQSYTYFAWKNTSGELRSYMEEITQPPVSLFFRPNFWPNTPDILTEHLRKGGRPAFVVRVVLAATLSASYGIYGPAYERVERRGMENGTEEYLNSEKYQRRKFVAPPEGDLTALLARLNAIRRSEPALRRNGGLFFHGTDNPALLAYSKRAASGAAILVIANLDPHHTQSGFTDLERGALGLGESEAFTVHDLLDGERYAWYGRRNYVELPPDTRPCHIFRIRPSTAPEP